MKVGGGLGTQLCHHSAIASWRCACRERLGKQLASVTDDKGGLAQLVASLEVSGRGRGGCTGGVGIRAASRTGHQPQGALIMLPVCVCVVCGRECMSGLISSPASRRGIITSRVLGAYNPTLKVSQAHTSRSSCSPLPPAFSPDAHSLAKLVLL